MKFNRSRPARTVSKRFSICMYLLSAIQRNYNFVFSVTALWTNKSAIFLRDFSARSSPKFAIYHVALTGGLTIDSKLISKLVAKNFRVWISLWHFCLTSLVQVLQLKGLKTKLVWKTKLGHNLLIEIMITTGEACVQIQPRFSTNEICLFIRSPKCWDTEVSTPRQRSTDLLLLAQTLKISSDILNVSAKSNRSVDLWRGVETSVSQNFGSCWWLF